MAQEPTLRSNAEAHNLYIGTAVNPAHLHESAYQQILDKQFSAVTPENAMKWGFVEAQRGNYTFENADKIVSHAQENGQIVRGHTLVWYKQIPEWVTNGDFNASELKSILEWHIKEEVTRFKGKIYAWDVVNEALDQSGNYRNSLWYQKLGQQYIAHSFKWAHSADPNAKLYINDYSIEGINSKSTALYNLVKELKAQSVPIDGVGFQSHFRAGHIPSNLQQNMQRFAALGVDVAITELDIRVHTPHNSSDLQTQANDYKTVAQACRAVSRCVGITLWGFTDKYSWVPKFFSGQGAALLYDDNYKEKPAFAAFRDALA